MTQPRPKLLADWVANPPTGSSQIFSPDREEGEPPIGEGFEVPLGSLWLDPAQKRWHLGSERWLVIRSYALAQRQIKGLEKR